MARTFSVSLTGLALLLTVLLGACSSSTPAPEEPTVATTTEAPAPEESPASSSSFTFTTPPVAKMVTYTDKEEGFSILYPKNWDTVSRGEMCKNGVVCFQAPKQQGFVPAMIMVSVMKDQQGLENLATGWNTLRQLVIDSWGPEAKTVPGSAGDTTLAGLPAKTATYDVTATFVDYTMIQTMTMNDEIVFYTVSTGSTADTWKDMESTFKDATDSFTLT